MPDGRNEAQRNGHQQNHHHKACKDRVVFTQRLSEQRPLRMQNVQLKQLSAEQAGDGCAGRNQRDVETGRQRFVFRRNQRQQFRRAGDAGSPLYGAKQKRQSADGHRRRQGNESSQQNTGKCC
jgi:hypothetical protein